MLTSLFMSPPVTEIVLIFFRHKKFNHKKHSQFHRYFKRRQKPNESYRDYIFAAVHELCLCGATCDLQSGWRTFYDAILFAVRRCRPSGWY